MKCKKCGKTISKNDKFCGNCGAKITKEMDEKTLRILKENKLKIILSFILVFVIGVTYFLVNYLNSATYIAKKYFDAVTHNKTEEVYELLEIKDTDLMNLDLLKKKIKEYKNVSDIEVVDEKVNGNNALITFKYSDDKNENLGSVHLVKKDGKWTVDSGVIASNVVIKLPKNAKVKLDNIDISSYLDKDKSNDDIDIYTIDYMPKGKYKIIITLKDGTEIEDDIEITSDNTYTLGSIELTSDASNALNSKSLDLINNIYNGIINNTSELTYNNNIDEYYKDLNYDYKNSNYTLKNFKINDLKEINVTDSNGKLQVTYQVEYEYTINYDGNDYSGTNRDRVTLYFDYDYEIYSIKDLGLRFPIRK